jgi:phosphatidate cytidylyltransferase
MFKLRLLSVLVLIPIIVIALLKLPSSYVAIASGFVFTLGAWEWLRITVSSSAVLRVVLLALLIAIAFNLLAVGLDLQLVYWVALLWWIGGFVSICYYPRGAEIWRQLALQPFIGLVMFVPAWLAFNELHAQAVDGPLFVLLGCSLIWGADIGAYCCGKLWGKAKLIENVSPGKTWVGFYGALITGCVIMLGFYFGFRPNFSLWYALWLALFTVVFAVVGDLVESLVKRVYGVKDSGSLIPGHGGVYDRIDSMLSAFPIYALGLQILQGLRLGGLDGF